MQREKLPGYMLELLAGSKGIHAESLIWQHYKGLSLTSSVEGVSKTYQTHVNQEPNQAMLLSWVQKGDIQGFVCHNMEGQLLWGYPGAMGNLGGHTSEPYKPSKDAERRIYRLVSSTQSGYYALDDQTGRALAFGDRIAIEVANAIWVDGIIDHSVQLGEPGCYTSENFEAEECGHYFISNDGGQILGLCTGMRVKLLEEDKVYWLEKR